MSRLFPREDIEDDDLEICPKCALVIPKNGECGCYE